MQPGEPSLLTRILAVTAGAALLVLGFMFSLMILAIVVVVGLLAWGYVWWKTRALRRTMKQAREHGQVIDGEAVVIDESSSVHVVTREDVSRPADRG